MQGLPWLARALVCTALSSAAAATASTGFASSSPLAALSGCQAASPPSPAALDRLLQFGAHIQQALSARAAPVALMARSGMNLQRLGHRYSHAGFVLPPAASPAPSTSAEPERLSAWRVRQLYYDCGPGRPRLFDEGLPGFVIGANAESTSRISVVLLPAASAAILARRVEDAPSALSLLGAAYSANAYAWGTVHQNCNQWVAEMLALSFAPGHPIDGRERAQDWLREQGAQPSVIEWPGWMPGFMVPALPHVHVQGHPQDDLRMRRFVLWMPQSLEQWLHQWQPQSRRMEFCLREQTIVVRHGWTPLGPDCAAQDGDEEHPIQDVRVR